MSVDYRDVYKRLTLGAFEGGVAPVYLDGQPIAKLHRSPGWIRAEVLGISRGGGKNYTNALKSVAVGYEQITEHPEFYEV